MIKTLPLLPSTWAEWDWTQSNGNATVTQMEKGYEALLNKGLCSSFSRYIWNDLVDCVANVIEEIGLTWDTTYCSASACKISQQYGSLTATMFNSVALNIHRFGIVAWKWAKQPTTTGYVGRDTFRGYSSFKNNADFLYGWYIVELTTKLNRVIQVLKEEADFGEFNSSIQVSTVFDIPLASVRVGAVTHVDKSVSQPYISMSRIGVIANATQALGYSYQNGILLPTERVCMNEAIQATSEVLASSDGIRTAAVSYIAPAETYSNTALSPLVFVGYMKHDAHIETKVVAPLDISNIVDMIFTLMEESYTLTSLSKAWSHPITAEDFSNSYEHTTLKYLESLPLLAVPYGTSHSFTTALTLNPSPMHSVSVESAHPVSVLHRIRPLYIQRSIRDYSYPVGKMNVMGCAPVSSLNHSASYKVAEAVASGIKVFTYKGYAETLADSVLHKFRPVYVDSTLQSDSYDDVCLNLGVALPVTVAEKSESKTDAYILKGIPRLAEFVSEGISYGRCVIHIPSIRRLTKTLKAYSYDDTQMSYTIARARESIEESEAVVNGSLSLATGNTDSIIAANARYYAVIENYAGEEIDWLDPVRTVNDLYVRQVYNPWSKESILYLDAELWYSPVRTDNNLHIRSEGSIDGGNLNG